MCLLLIVDSNMKLFAVLLNATYATIIVQAKRSVYSYEAWCDVEYMLAPICWNLA